MLFNVNRISDVYKGQFIDVTVGNGQILVWLMYATDGDEVAQLVMLYIDSVADAISLANNMKIPFKING